MKQDDAFAEATRTSLIPINNWVLFASTVVGGLLSVYGDLFQGQLAMQASRCALAGWILAIAVILYLAGRSTGNVHHFGRVWAGVGLARRHRTLAVLILVLTAGTSFSAYSRAKSDTGGALATLLTAVLQVQRTATEAAAEAGGANKKASQILSDTAAIAAVVTKPKSPAELLIERGYAATESDLGRAFSINDEDALKLFRNAGITKVRLSKSLGGGEFALGIESLLLDSRQPAHLDEVFSWASPDATDLNRLYLSQELGPDQSHSHLQGVGALIGYGKTTKIKVLEVRATPAMFSVWGGNVGALKALLSQSADPDAGAKLLIGVERMVRYEAISMTYRATDFFIVTLSPLAEAQRLGHAAMQAELRARGAKALARKARYQG